MPYRPRSITPADLPSIVPLLDSAYSPNPTFDSRLRTYFAVQPDGWVAVDGESGVVGVGGFVAFERCAYVGLMAVAPEAQRRGIGALIFDEILARCEATGRGLLLLDASIAGAPLYAKRSFVDRGRALSYAIDPKAVSALEGSPGIHVAPLELSDTAAVAHAVRLDARSFGADRTSLVHQFLAKLPGRAFLARDGAGEPVGYAAAQSRSFGPCVAGSTAVARALLRRAMALPFDGPVTWLVPSQNAAAMKLAEEVGGAPARTWRHMRRGPEALLASDWSTVFAKASLAVG